jgi:hypothetical protein
MNRLDNITRAQVINCLIEGCPIRATVRMTGVAKKTVMRLLVEVGEVCAVYQDQAFRNLRCKRLQLIGSLMAAWTARSSDSYRLRERSSPARQGTRADH